MPIASFLVLGSATAFELPCKAIWLASGHALALVPQRLVYPFRGNRLGKRDIDELAAGPDPEFAPRDYNGTFLK
jgi:hypothetical protein